MKTNYDNIGDDEIRIISGNTKTNPKVRRRNIGIILGLLLVCALFLWFFLRKPVEPPVESLPESYFETWEPTEPNAVADVPVLKPLSHLDKDLAKECNIEVLDTIINDIPLQVFIPHRAKACLHLGPVNPNDTSLVYVAQAADIRADNGKILGAFVLAGKPLAWGLSKKGFCAIIEDRVTVGVSENSPLFEEATEKGGYFFRQYPLVNNGKLVENEPKNKSYRRAICQRLDETFMVHSLSQESFHDFAQALVDLHVDNAVYLIGSTAYGWCIDESRQKIEWGEPITGRIPQNTSYLIWKIED